MASKFSSNGGKKKIMVHEKEWKPSHRLVDCNGFDIDEPVMLDKGKYFTYESWYHNDKPETDASLKELGWFAISSFREEED
jgi:hypothetical protein